MELNYLQCFFAFADELHITLVTRNCTFSCFPVANY